MSLLRLFVKTSEGENIPVDASDTDCIQDVKNHLNTQGIASALVLPLLQAYEFQRKHTPGRTDPTLCGQDALQ